MKKILLAYCFACFVSVCWAAEVKNESFTSYELFPDTSGEHINAHGAGVLLHEGVYYLYGELKGRAYSARGVSCYSSKDLYNWENAGAVLTTVSKKGHDIERGCIIERPKVVYNKKTNKFVMWFHLELRGQGYAAARTGMAISDLPTGPFEYIKSFRPNPGIWPVNYPADLYNLYKDGITGDQEWWFQGYIGDFVKRDLSSGQMARDMTVFVDDDGKAYHIHASEENQTLHICELTDDYMGFTGRYVRILPGASNEAPALCKHNGRYYLLTSGCTGWEPNAARLASAPSIWGPWRYAGNPCEGINSHNNMGPELTYGGQSTYLLPVQGKEGCFIAMFDQWRPSNQQDSRYLWLPAYVKDDSLKVVWQSTWKLSWFDHLEDE